MDTTFDTPATGRHPVNTGHLVMGLAFAGLVGIWALIVGDVVADDDIRWLLPIPWVGGGLIGLGVATWANMRSRNQRASSFDSSASTTWPSDTTATATTHEGDDPDDLTTVSEETDLGDDATTATYDTDDTEATRPINDDTDPTEEIR